jgi:hypothetical protein
MASSPALPTTVLGYHGTEASSIGGILKNGFRPGVGVALWLGDGCYFYEDLEYTKWWCARYPPLKGKSVRYLRATLIYGKVLNLSPTIIESLLKFGEIIQDRPDLEKFLGEHNAKKLTIAIAINEYCKFVEKMTGKGPDTVRNSRTRVINQVYPFPGAKFWTGGTPVEESIVCVRPHARDTHIRDIREVN